MPARSNFGWSWIACLRTIPNSKRSMPPRSSTFFEAWFHNGDKLELAEALREKSDWRAIGWKQLVRSLCRVWRLSECVRHGARIRFDTACARTSSWPYRRRSRTTSAAASHRHRHRCGALPRAGERRPNRPSLGATTSAARRKRFPRLSSKPRSETLGEQSRMGQSLECSHPIRLRLRPHPHAHAQFVSGERRLLACWRRQLAGAPFSARLPKSTGKLPVLPRTP